MDKPRLVRVWDMPNRHTFLIPTVQSLLRRFVDSGTRWVDPFANDHSPAQFTNDLNPETTAKEHMDALDFLRGFQPDTIYGVLLDPPYSRRQITEVYEGYGHNRVNAMVPIYDEVARILEPMGLVISFGWNSNGLGASRGFDLLEVVMIPHGGQHYDTIITVEQKLHVHPSLGL